MIVHEVHRIGTVRGHFTTQLGRGRVETWNSHVWVCTPKRAIPTFAGPQNVEFPRLPIGPPKRGIPTFANLAPPALASGALPVRPRHLHPATGLPPLGASQNPRRSAQRSAAMDGANERAPAEGAAAEGATTEGAAAVAPAVAGSGGSLRHRFRRRGGRRVVGCGPALSAPYYPRFFSVRLGS